MLSFCPLRDSPTLPLSPYGASCALALCLCHLLTLLCVDPCLQGLRFAEPRALSQLSSLRLRGGGNPKVFLDVTIGDQSAGRVVMELYGE